MYVIFLAFSPCKFIRTLFISSFFLCNNSQNKKVGKSRENQPVTMISILDFTTFSASLSLSTSSTLNASWAISSSAVQAHKSVSLNMRGFVHWLIFLCFGFVKSGHIRHSIPWIGLGASWQENASTYHHQFHSIIRQTKA